MPLTEEQVFEHIAALQIGCDPKSPFYRKVSFRDGLLALPIEDQWQVYNQMDDNLKNMIKEASEDEHSISE